MSIVNDRRGQLFAKSRSFIHQGSIAWLIDTEWFGCQVVSRNLVGPRAASAADFDEFTMAAFAFVFVQIAEVGKYVGAVPDVPKALFFNLAAINLQIAAGLHLPGMRDEAEGASAETTARHRMQRIFRPLIPRS